MIPRTRLPFVAALVLAAFAPVHLQAADPPPAPPSEAAKALKALNAEAEAALLAFTEKRAAATAVEKKALERDSIAASVRFATRALAIARTAAPAPAPPTDPAAVEALQFALGCCDLEWGSDEASDRVMDEAVGLVGSISFRPKDLSDLLPSVDAYRSPASEALLARVHSKHADRTVRGQASFLLAQALVDLARDARTVAQNEPHPDDPARLLARLKATDPAATTARAIDLYESVCKDYADVAVAGQREAVGPTAERALYALRNLAVGKVAPEIEGKDFDDRSLKLSDSRGKVVVLVFQMMSDVDEAVIASRKAMGERFKNRPFALLEVNADPDPTKYRDAMKAKGAAWPCWRDGPGGPICAKWNVHTFPTVFVLDAKGTIRFTELRDEALEKAVEGLLAEPKP